MQQGENPVFLFDNFFKVWDQPYLKILIKKIPPSVFANGG